MPTKLVTIRMDEQLKNDFDDFCHAAGLSVTNAFTVYAKTVVRERRIPFDVSADPFYSADNMSALRSSKADADKGKFVATAAVGDFDALMANL